MGKKKLSLKPVQRGFATSSVSSKKPIPAVVPEPEASPQSANSVVKALEAGNPAVLRDDPVATDVQNDIGPGQGAETPADWEDDDALERTNLQSLVERLHDKGEKEVARIVKAIEYDRRLAASFPKLNIDEEVKHEALEMALERLNMDDNVQPLSDVTSIAPSARGQHADRTLLRLFITYHVLDRLGFEEKRIEESILQGLREGEGWDAALEWLWTRLSEDECLQQGKYAKQEVPSLIQPDEPLLDLSEDVISSPEPEAVPPADPNPAPDYSKPLSTAPPASLFQSLGSSSSEADSDDDDFDGRAINKTWATLSIQLDTLRQAAGIGKGKTKKTKGSSFLPETPEVRELKAKIAKTEKEYLFNRKMADTLFRSMKSQRDATDLASRFKDASLSSEGSAQNLKGAGHESHDGNAAAQPAVDDLFADGSDDEEIGGLLGGMLDQPADPEPDDNVPDNNTTINVKSMPIPKSSFAGNIPKNILKTALNKQTKQPIVTFAKLSGASRAARAGLELRWSTTRKKVWRMDEVACENMAEAENYVSTVALSDLSSDGTLTGVNWRTMPSAYRDLWEELEVKRKENEDSGKRDMWAKIKTLLDKKTNSASTGEKDVQPRETRPPMPSAAANAKDMQPHSFSQVLQDGFESRRKSRAYQEMLAQRQTLPIAGFREQIVSTLDSSQVLVLSGETGCGKSTQLPSFILEDQLAKGRPCKIFVTEPRRISAISLAQRVSQELGDPAGAMGTNASLVGYSIRLEAKISAATRLAFVTNGIALRMLESGSTGTGKGTAFDEITHIIVDEVHERSIESDFLLIVLKNLCQQRRDLKIVLMSATVDAEKISNFFGGCPFIAVPGRTFPVQVNYLEDAVQLAKWQIDENSPYALRGRTFKPASQLVEWNEEGAKSDSDPSDGEHESTTGASDPAKLSSTRYSASTVSTLNLLDSRQIPYDLIVRLLERICYEDETLVPYSQATLVFMPGLAEIRKLNDMLQSHPAFGSNEFVVWPLHSTISSEGQSAVFNLPPQGVRKIVISTNIAETGVTIPDITCVIDSGKHREMRYDEKRQLSRLVETYIARSNAKQRRGRAGRVQEGLAFHLFTKARHDLQLAEHPIPEMLRLSLQDLALRIKVLKVSLGETIESVLSQALDPPSSINIQRAVASLVEVKALTLNEDITPMGRLLSKLPMDVHLGKFLLTATMMRCLDPALTIAATLNSKSPFVTPFGFEAAARVAKQSFAVGNSDFLTIANVFDSFRKASDTPGFVKTFCKRNFVSLQNLQQIEELRQQLLSYLVDSSFVEATPAQRKEVSQARFSRGVKTRFVSVPSELNSNGGDAQIIGAALVAGLYPKLLSLDSSPGGGLKTIINQQPVAIHPSSVNFKVPKADFGTNYLVYFTIMQSRRLYAWETSPVDDRALALLCGDVADFKISASSLYLDRKIKYRVDPKSAIAIKLLREQFAQAQSQRLRGKQLTATQEKWFDLGLRCLKQPQEEEVSVGLI